MKLAKTPREFPLPSMLKAVAGTERAQAAHPYNTQFSKADDERFWFYNSMHFPEPMSAFDMVTAEAAYCALGSANTRVHCLPTTLGIDYRVINGRVYIGGNAVTDPDEIARRKREFEKRAFYYYEHWETLYRQWREKMLALIADAEALPKPELPDLEPLAHVHAGKGVASNHYLLDTYQQILRTKSCAGSRNAQSSSESTTISSKASRQTRSSSRCRPTAPRATSG
jgi:pyruvate,water dikinase